MAEDHDSLLLPIWMKLVLLAATIYNIVWGGFVTLIWLIPFELILRHAYRLNSSGQN